MKHLYSFAIALIAIFAPTIPSHAANPTAPSNLQACTVSASEIGLSWTDKSKNETGFKIQRAPDCNGNPGAWTQIATVGANVTSFKNTGLPANTKFWYRVRAYNSKGESACSSQDSATTLPRPPSNLTAGAVSTTQINLSWTPDAKGQNGFKIERSPGSNSCAGAWSQIAMVGAGVTSYHDKGLTPGTTYWYRVRAYNCAGDSAYSNVASATTPTPCPLFVNEWGYLVGDPPPGLKGVVAISAGAYHGLALKDNGTVVGWGQDFAGAVTPPTNLAGVKAIAAGYSHSLALKQNGTVIGWGNNDYAQATPPTNLTGVVAIAAGGAQSLALKSNGTVVGWGYDGGAPMPTNLTGVVAIAAGGHNLALRSNGTVVGWGYEGYGATTPPTNLTGVVAIAAGGAHSLALKSNGTVVGWGADFYGEATPPTNLTGVVAIAAGDYHSLALKSDGTVVGWGEPPAAASPPTNLTGVIAIAAGGNRSVALSTTPNPPSALIARIPATNQIALSWPDSTAGQTGFQIERTTNNPYNVLGDPDFKPPTWTQIGMVSAGVTNFSDTTVTTNRSYWYQVRAHNRCGDSLFSYAVGVTVAPPAAPYYLSANAFSDRADLFWYPSSGGEVGYRIERALDESGNPGTWAEIAMVSASDFYYENYADHGLAANTTYWYRVRAFNGVGISPYSETARVTILPPGAPMYLWAMIGSTNQVNLTWSAAAPADQDGFKVERALDAGGVPGTWTEIAKVTTNAYYGSHYIDSGITTNATYWYRVRVFNVLGDSPYSSAVSVSVVPPGAPYLSAGVFADRVNLYWYHNYAGEIQGVKLERATDAGGSPGTWAEIATITNYSSYYTDTGLAVNTTYWYRLRAYNWIGESPYSSEVSVTIVPPGAPYYLNATVGSTNLVNLGWYAAYPADQDGFKIERAPDASGNPGTWAHIATIGATNNYYGYYEDSGMATNATYWYRVRAFNSLGDSPYSGPASVRVTPPDAPYLSATPFVTRVNLSWDDYFGGVMGFKLERAPDAAGSPGAWQQIVSFDPAGNSSGSYADTGRTPNATYWYRVRAYNWIGDSAYSSEVSVTIVPPAAPYSLTARIGTTNHTDLSWFDNAGDEDGFKIERAMDAGGSPGAWTQIATVGLTNNYYSGYFYYNDPGVVTNITYWYRVRAFNIVGDSAYTDPSSVSVVRPPAPSYLSASPFANQVNLSWNNYYGNYGHVDGFKIERAADAGGSPGTWTQIVTLTNGSYSYYSDLGGAANTTYWYRVRAFNWIGDSPYSDLASATIVPPAAPYALSGAVGTTNQVNLFWYSGYPYDQDGFKIERASDIGGNPGAWAEIGTTTAAFSYYNYFTDTNVTANTTNWYRVRAFNVVGVSAYSLPLSMRVVPPDAPMYLSASPFADRVNLYWSLYYSGELGGYKVERALDVGGSPGAWTQVALVTNSYYNSYTDTGRAANTTYWYRVRVFNWIGDSPYSDPASVTIVPPGAPTYLSATVGTTNQVNLTVYAAYPYDQDGFKLERAPDAGGNPGAWTETAAISATNFYSAYYTDTNVTANTTNWYRARAFNVVGISPYSTPISVSIVPPGTPLGLVATAVASNRVNLSWYDYTGAIEGYKIERAPDVGGSPGAWSQIAKVVGYYNYYYNDAGVAVNNTYWYRVRAYNWTGDSPYSDPVSVNVALPTAPANLTAINDWRNQISLAWVNTSSNVTGFKIERAPDGGGSPGAWTQIASVAGHIANYADGGRETNKSYWYRVRASNLVGDSPYSNEATALVRDGQFVRVMQWNIEHNLGRPGGTFNFAAQSIARIVNYNQPDVLLFNEIDAQNLTAADIEGALIDWVTNSLTYLGTQSGVSFHVAVSSKTDGFNRNAAISRYPLVSPMTYDDGLRGLHSMRVQLSPGNAVQIFHTHLKCCADDCTRKQTEAEFDAGVIGAFAATNSLPYLFAGDWNEEEEKQPPVCTLSSSYHPITTIRQGARLMEFKPTTLEGEYRTWSSQDYMPSIRFDYILSASNRLAATGGHVFNSYVWANRGLYNGNYYDSYYASDHYCVFANYYFADPGFIVSPVNTFTSSGNQNGPFSPASQSYTLSNLTSSSLTWTVTNTANWLTASPTGGTLGAGATTSVVLSINAPANALTPGSYEDNVRFLNPSNGATVLVNARLDVQWSPLLTAAVTKPATGISATGAVLNGLMSPGTNQTLAWFEWGVDTNYGNIAGTTLVAASSTPPVALTNALSGLNADLVYHYRIAVSNVLGIVRGLDVAFQVGVLPTAITLAPTAVTADGATLAASINPGGRSTTAYFQWGDSTAYGNSTTATPVGSGAATVSFVASITGLSPTIYHYRAVASNSLGVTFGADVAFGRSVVDANDVHQRIDGFGASCAYRSSLTTAQADMLFSTNKGIGLSLIRSRIRPDGGSDELNCMLAAQQRGAKVWSTPWSPPVAYKDSGTVNGGNFRGGTATNRAYAAQLARYAVNMKNAGINLYAISIQNEPDISTTYESCLWTADQFHDFIPFLSSALVASNVASVKIMMPEHANWRFDLAQSSMSDANVSNKVGILAAHGYYSSAYAVQRYDKALWETEDSTFGDTYDGSMANGLVWAGRIHDYLTVAEVNAWHYWWLINFNADNEGLTDQSGNPAKRMYALGQFSRFVRPGYYRVGVANAGSVLVSAYQDTNSGNFAIVAINSGDSSLVQAFRLANFASVSSVTPCITSASLSLSNQPAITVSNASFVYTLPANSIVTFAGRATATAPTFLVTPPADLTSTGPIGGPFTPASQTYTLSNSGNATISWAASNSASFVSLSASNGTLAAGASTNIIVSFTANANILPTGAYSDSVSFINATDGNGNTARAVHLAVVYPSAGLFGFYDDFSTFASGDLVGQNGWAQALASSSLPLQIAAGGVVIPFGQSTDNQDAYKNFTATNATVFYGMTLTVNNAPASASPSYFAALYTGNNVSGFANYRLSARDNGAGAYVLAARITGQAGNPFTFGTTGLAYGTQHRVILEADSGGTVLSVFVDPTSSNLADQTAYLINNIGGGSPPPTVGSFVISQFGSGSAPNVGLATGKACVADNFANVYNFLAGVVPPPVITALPGPASATALQITSVIRTNNDVWITWQTVGGTTNVVQAASSLDQPFANLSPSLIIPGSGNTATSYLDAGAMTNTSSRFYRIRLAP